MEKPKVRFLRRSEIENYLLVPEAIARAISEQADIDDINFSESSPEEISRILSETLNVQDEEVFPHGREADPLTCAKGSVVLERIFKQFELAYSKKSSGRLIANHITLKNQPALEELFDLVKDLFI